MRMALITIVDVSVSLYFSSIFFSFPFAYVVDCSFLEEGLFGA
jgi:hypothetical protein